MADLEGKHAVVSGGGTGIGADIATTLADAGAAVSIIGRRAEPLRDTAKRNSAISWQVCDVTDEGAVAEAISEIRKRDGKIDIAIANAGSAHGKPFAKMSAGDLRQTIDVNLTGVFNLWHASVADMLETGWGRLLAIASTAGLKGYSYVSGYCAAKHGVIGLTRSIALELAQSGITANAICPGYVETPLLEESLDNIVAKTGMSREQAAEALMANNPQRRFIQPAEVSNAVLWLCGANAHSMTGQAISISGGEI